MIQLSRLKDVELQKAESLKQDNGAMVSNYTTVASFQCVVEQLSDAVSASIYGADVTRMYRLTSVHNALEQLLASKMNNTSDNISKYFIMYNNIRFKIVSVRENGIDIRAYE